ncbi:MAG TPA: sigma-70 family RNA polymerase sigma factor [Puia sp.]|jgi:RNA polymerase sigma factor (sigma-70 family)|nr:sigma-70 family RNA polymerase sigma factor [Puia sp.]
MLKEISIKSRFAGYIPFFRTYYYMKVEGKISDSELIVAISDKTQLNDAILSIYRQYSDIVSSFLINYGASEQDADDVFQETVIAFINIVQQGRFRMEASIKTFLVSVARNIWRNEQKKRLRTDFREQRFESGRPQSEDGVNEWINESDKKRQLRDLVFKLGEPCRKLLTLFYYENLSMKEMLNYLPYDNEQVVRNKKYKCLQQLTDIMKNHPSIAGQLNELTK